MSKRISPADYLRIRKNIVKKLYAYGAFVHGHLLFERLRQGIPSHLAGFVKQVLDDLLKEEIVLFYKRTKHGDAYQLNIKKLKEIEEIII
ncbi:hypothetical protein HYU16_03465 [Candidatus Woesearchaeota archaeon]|nr:hypothetical protein [Candidatus Woesearchaeota archaeon]